MRVSTTKEELEAVLAVAARIASPRSAVAALAGVQFRAAEGRIEVRATDSEVGVRLPLVGLVEQEGVVTVTARTLYDVVRAAAPGAATLEYLPEPDSLELRIGRNKTAIRALRSKDFPELPADDGDFIEMPAAELADAVARVAPAASRDQTRPVLTGVSVQASGRTLELAATDSYRLAVCRTELPEPVARDVRANVPARAMAELERLVRETGATTVQISQPRQQAVFAVGDAVLSTRLIAGDYPSYEQLIPASSPIVLDVPREALLDVVRRVSLLALKNAPLALSLSDGLLEARAVSQDVGDSSEAVDLDYAGEPLTVGFNPQYLREALEAFADERVSFALTNALTRSLLSSGDGLRYLLMPVRVPGAVPDAAEAPETPVPSA